MGETRESAPPSPTRRLKLRLAWRRVRVISVRGGVRANRFAHKYRDGLELGLILVLGIATIFFAIQANNFAAATKDATELQAKMTKFSSLPNFVIKEKYLSPFGDRAPMSIVIENEGGWARYAEVRAYVGVSLFSVTPNNVRHFIGMYWVENYLMIDGVELGEDYEPIRWIMSSKADGYRFVNPEDSFESFFEDVLRYLSVQRNLENLEISLDVYIHFSYGDHQGQKQSEFLQIARDYEAGEHYLALLPEESWNAFAPGLDNTIRFPLSEPRGSSRWDSEIAKWGEVIYKDYID